MSTTLPRHNVTEIPELRRALAVARSAWPEEKSPTKLIYRLASRGAEQIQRDAAATPGARRRLAESLAGRFPATLPPDYLEGLREEWDR